MLNRFKLLVLAIILVIFTILFFQNQELLSLKLFCSDPKSEYCFYQTPSISLAVWMGGFMALGVFSSLIWQLLKALANSTIQERKSSRTSQTRTSYREQSNLRKEADFATTNRRSTSSTSANNYQVSDWEQRKSEDWEQANGANFAQDDQPLRSSAATKSSESDYNDKSSNKDQELNLRKRPLNQVTSPESSPMKSKIRQGTPYKRASNSESSKPKSSASKAREEVYDANYRTLNDVPPPFVSKDDTTEDEDSDWI